MKKRIQKTFLTMLLVGSMLMPETLFAAEPWQGAPETDAQITEAEEEKLSSDSVVLDEVSATNVPSEAAETEEPGTAEQAAPNDNTAESDDETISALAEIEEAFSDSDTGEISEADVADAYGFSVITMNQADYENKMNAFINDGRWRNGVAFSNANGPKLSTFRSAGCFAYGCDFSKYMYNVNNYNDGQYFANKNEIRTGDVLRINNDAHTIVVLKRDGDSLYTAEGNYANKVRVANGAYKVSSLNLTKGFHFVNIQTKDVGTPMQTGSGQTLPNGDYYIVSGITDRGIDPVSWTSLDIAGVAEKCANGTNVQVWMNNMYSKTDIFTLTYLDNGFYRITQKGTNMALDVSASSLDAERNIQMYETIETSPGQMWSITEADDISGKGTGWYVLQAKCSGFCLDVVGGDNQTPANGTNVQQYRYYNTKNQKWKFIPASAGEVTDGDYHLVSALGDDLGLGIDAGTYPNAVIRKNTADSDAVFTVTKEASGSYYLTWKKSGELLDIEQGGTVKNVGVWVGTDSKPNGAGQRWFLKEAGDGYYYVVSAYNGANLDVAGAGTAEGTNVQVHWNNYSDAQKWKLVAAETKPSDETEPEKKPTDETEPEKKPEDETSSESEKETEQEPEKNPENEEEKSSESDSEKDSETEQKPDQTTKPTVLAVKQKLDVRSLFAQTYQKYQVAPKERASITNKGLLSAKKSGEITVTGLVKSGKTWVADTENAVTVVAETPTFQKNTVELYYIGAEAEAKGNLGESNLTPTSWTSGNAKVARVDASTGKITAVKSGSAKVYAVYGSGKQAAKYGFAVKVIVPSISKKKATMQTGATLSLTLNKARALPTWKSENEEIATVDSDGKITAKTAGRTTITATLDGVSYQCALTVKKPTLSFKKATLKVDKTKTIKLKNTKLSGATWVSSDPSVAEVNEKGEITAKSKGTAEIKTTTGGCTDVCKITVK